MQDLATARGRELQHKRLFVWGMVTPQISISGSTFSIAIQEFGEGLIQLNVSAVENLPLQILVDRDPQVRHVFDVAAARLPGDPHTAAGIDALLPMQGDVIQKFCNNNMSQEAGTDAGLGDHLRGQGRHDGSMGTLTAGIHRSDDLAPEEQAGPVLNLLGDLLADLHQSCFLLLGKIDQFTMDRQILWRSSPATALLLLCACGAGRLGGGPRQCSLCGFR